ANGAPAGAVGDDAMGILGKRDSAEGYLCGNARRGVDHNATAGRAGTVVPQYGVGHEKLGAWRRRPEPDSNPGGTRRILNDAVLDEQRGAVLKIDVDGGTGNRQIAERHHDAGAVDNYRDGRGRGADAIDRDR